MGVIFIGKDGAAQQQLIQIDTTLLQVRHPEISGPDRLRSAWTPGAGTTDT